MTIDLDTQQRAGQIAAAVLTLVLFAPPLMWWWDWRDGNAQVWDWIAAIPLVRWIPAGLGFGTAIVLLTLIFIAIRRLTNFRRR